MWGMLATAGISMFNNAKASGKSYGLNLANANTGMEQANENIRKTKLSQEQTVGSTVAGAGASGISMKSESVTTYLDAMKDNFKKEIDWMEKARDANYRLERQGGKNQRDIQRAQMFGDVMGAFAKGADK